MGLDMYLYGVKASYNMHDYNIGSVKTLIEVGYWRKANQIHKWFVDNIQGGEDNCAMYCLDKDDLKELQSICEEVLNNPEKAHELLPTEEGFFFGSQEYDEFYFYDIKETIEICKWCLERDFDWFYYNSSW